MKSKLKTLEDFTPSVQAKIPEYIKRFTNGVFDGGKYNAFKKENAEELINWNYEQCSYKKPVMIVAENPLEMQVLFNYIVENKEVFLPVIYLNYCLINKIEIPKGFLHLQKKIY